MKAYLMRDLNDPTKYKVEYRSYADGTLCEVPEHLVGKELAITETEVSPGVYEYSVDFDPQAQEAKDAEQAALAEAQNKRTKYANRLKFAEQVKVEITVLNESKNWDVAQVTAYLSDSTIQQINSLLSNISFGSAVQLIQSSDLSAYYTNEEKQSIVDMLTNYMNGE